MNNRKVGAAYENMACNYLIKNGYRIRERNFRVRQAELDIVAEDGGTLVFCEVKYRNNEKKGNPLDAVDGKKQRQISKAALFYMNCRRIDPYACSIRFDVIGILGTDIRHIKNAFDFTM